MLRISSRRLMWVANRRALTRPEGGRWGDERAIQEHREMVELQDRLTHAVKAVGNRPVAVCEVPESAADYNDQDTDTTDPDFDTYIEANEQVREWVRTLPRREN